MPLTLTCNGGTEPRRGAPASMQVVAGDSQSAVVGTELSAPLVVRVLDAQGSYVAGQVVNFRVTAGGGSVFAGAAITNDNGIAQERWTLGTSTSDSQRVEVRAVDSNTGEARTFAVFRATALPGPAAAALVAAGDSQQGFVGAPLAESLGVRVRDGFGNPVPGQWVRWSVLAGGGSVSADSSAAGAAGVAKVSWALGPRLDTTHVAQAVVGTVATLTITATPLLPGTVTLTKTAGDAQLDTVAHALPVAPLVTVALADGRPVRGAQVTFSVTGGGGSVTGAVSSTNANGVASAGGWTLGTVAGANQLLATVGSQSVTFAATAVAGPPGALAWARPLPDTARNRVALAPQPAVQLTDEYGNAAAHAGIAVTASVATGGGTLAGTTSVPTDTQGIAAFTDLSLAGKAGPWTIKAASPGLTDTTGSVTLIAGSPVGLIAASAAVGADTVGALYRPSARVIDADSNGVAGVNVDLVVDSGGGSLAQSSVATDQSGEAMASWTLGSHSGRNKLSAAVPALPTVPAVVFLAYGLPVFRLVATHSLAMGLPTNYSATFNRTRALLIGMLWGGGQFTWDPATNGPWKQFSSTGDYAFNVAVLESKQQIRVFSGTANAPLYYDYATNTWNRANSGDVPANRLMSAMVYDSVNDRILLYGGVHADAAIIFKQIDPNPTAEVYSWDGAKWTRLPDSPAGPRAGHSMALDPKTGVIWIHGGVKAGVSNRDSPFLEWGTAATDTWTLSPDGVWRHVADLDCCSDAALVFDERRGTLVQAGGRRYPSSALGEFSAESGVWELIDGQWWHSTAAIAFPIDLVSAPSVGKVFAVTSYALYTYGDP